MFLTIASISYMTRDEKNMTEKKAEQRGLNDDLSVRSFHFSMTNLECFIILRIKGNLVSIGSNE